MEIGDPGTLRAPTWPPEVGDAAQETFAPVWPQGRVICFCRLWVSFLSSATKGQTLTPEMAVVPVTEYTKPSGPSGGGGLQLHDTWQKLCQL